MLGFGKFYSGRAADILQVVESEPGPLRVRGDQGDPFARVIRMKNRVGSSSGSVVGTHAVISATRGSGMRFTHITDIACLIAATSASFVLMYFLYFPSRSPSYTTEERERSQP